MAVIEIAQELQMCDFVDDLRELKNGHQILVSKMDESSVFGI